MSPSRPPPITSLWMGGVEINDEYDDRDYDDHTENTLHEKKKTTAINSPTLIFIMVQNLTVN